MVYSTVPASSPAGNGALPAAEVQSAAEPVSAPADVRMKGEDYQRLKQWKDAVGAPTFAQLHYRRDRWGQLACHARHTEPLPVRLGGVEFCLGRLFVV